MQGSPGGASLVLVAVVDPDLPGCPFTGLSEASTMMEVVREVNGGTAWSVCLSSQNVMHAVMIVK